MHGCGRLTERTRVVHATQKLMYACHEYQLMLAILILTKLKNMELRLFGIFDNSNSIWTRCIQRKLPIYELF